MLLKTQALRWLGSWWPWPLVVGMSVLAFGSMRLGLVATPVPFQYREHELAHILAHLRVRAFVTALGIGILTAATG